jgi:HPt (histidine-containing phosphotransfer) domain-containing protein
MSEPVIDEVTFRELQDAAGAEFVVELVDTFLEEAPGMLAALRQARAAGDGDAFRRAAHSLKSNGLTFGASALAAAARTLELGGIASEPALAALQRDFDAAAARLKELRDA